MYYAGQKLIDNAQLSRLSKPLAIALMIAIGIGLHNFEEIYEFKECVKRGEDCSLDNFKIEVFERYGKLILLKSKKEFLIDKDFKKIEFDFVVK